MYGIVSYSGSKATGFPVTLSGYKALSTVFATANPTGTSMDAYTPSNSPPVCPTSDSSWLVNPSAALPTIFGLRLESVTARTTIVSRPVSQTTAPPPGSTQTGGTDPSKGGGPGGGLGGGAIAGIGVACGAVLLGLGILAGVCFFRKRKARKLGEKPSASDLSDEHRAELPVPIGAVIPRQEMDAVHARRASGRGKWTEADSLAYKEEAYRGAVGQGNTVYEMDGSGVPMHYASAEEPANGDVGPGSVETERRHL